MHEELELLVIRGRERGASAGLRGLRLQIALARGEVVWRWPATVSAMPSTWLPA
jgi:hypothetical protein